MIKKLKHFLERHPYQPLMIMVVLEMVGSVAELSDAELSRVPLGEFLRWLRDSIAPVKGVLKAFPEEFFIVFTTIGLREKMRNLREKEFEVEGVLDKLRRTGESLEGIWRHGGGRKPDKQA